MANNEVLNINYEVTTNIVDDVCRIIENSQKAAFHAVNVELLKRNWLLGKRIAEEELVSNKREDNYGLKIIATLSTKLTEKYGRGFSKRAIYQYLEFYRMFPEIVQSLTAQSSPMLSWTHYSVLLRVSDSKARLWYEKEAANETYGFPHT